MAKDNDCVFCKIISGDLEGSFVYRNGNVSAFLDINPINRGHVLVISNKHYESFTEIETEVTGEMFKIAQKILKAISASNIRCEGANLFLSDGEIAGQEVPHSHLHIAPRFKGDGHRMGFTHVQVEESDRNQLNSTVYEIAKHINEQ